MHALPVRRLNVASSNGFKHTSDVISQCSRNHLHQNCSIFQLSDWSSAASTLQKIEVQAMAVGLAAIRSTSTVLKTKVTANLILDSQVVSTQRKGLIIRDVSGRLSSGIRGKSLPILHPIHRKLQNRLVLPSANLTTGRDEVNNRRSFPSPSFPSERNTNKSWTDEEGHDNSRIVAQLRYIAIAAQDRSEMHAIISVQRDNWNKLCHVTVTMSTIAAAILAAVNGATPALSMSVAAFLLNGGAGGFMFLVSQYQPSQLAEEQRTAARFFKIMAKEIEATLLIDPRLREDAHLYLENQLSRLEALDVAFPLHLAPGIENFPRIVRPSVLSPNVDMTEPEMASNNINGWTDTIAEDLKQTSQKIKTSDIELYLDWAREKEDLKTKLAIAAPAFAGAAAVSNLVAGVLPGMDALTCVAATLSVMGMLCFSFCHAGQIGMIFSLYRNCAGAYADIDNSIERNIRVPVCQREDGTLFHQRIAMQLGRQDLLPLVPSENKTAGKLF